MEPLQVLAFNDNRFSGNVPETLTLLTNLERLTVQFNEFEVDPHWLLEYIPEVVTSISPPLRKGTRRSAPVLRTYAPRRAARTDPLFPGLLCSRTGLRVRSRRGGNLPDRVLTKKEERRRHKLNHFSLCLCAETSALVMDGLQWLWNFGCLFWKFPTPACTVVYSRAKE